MSIYDKQNVLSDDQDFAGETTGTVVYSDNVLQVGPGDFGQGEDLKIDVIVTETFTNLGTIYVRVLTDDALPIDANSIVLYQTAPIPLASLVAGYKFHVKGIPKDMEKYLALSYTLSGGTDPDAGKIHAGLVMDTDDRNPSF